MVLGESEYRREIETDIEPFRGLFLGLFFITIGAQLDVPAVLNQPILIGGLALGLMAVKAAVMFGLARLFGAANRDAGAIGLALSQGGEFAFVLFGYAGGAGVLSAELTGLLTVVVAISMALTPLLLLAYFRLPDRSASAVPVPDDPSFADDRPHAIVAGFGRLGQVVGRLLIANGYRTVILENSAAQIELLRKFGRRVYYGDASRLDLLRAAGADKARLLAIAIDDREKAVDMVETAVRYFPHMTIIARAWDRRHAYQLQAAGAHVVERETFEAGLNMAAAALRCLGLSPAQAERAAALFRRHDLRVFKELEPVWNDDERFVVAARETSRVMEQLLAQDLRDLGVEAATADTTTRMVELDPEPGQAAEERAAS
jgi:glutathione-regulated potassium-efflux system ancillary protein KefC/glutathione-regulated potassium-efflux system protein KefB